VAAFIHHTKGGKYSALLPLLGLHQIEVAAENLRQVVKLVESLSKVKEAKATFRQVDARRRATFGTANDDDILRRIENLHAEYCPDKANTKDGLPRCADLTAALEMRTTRLSADQRRHLFLRAVAEVDLRNQVNAVRAASVKLAGAVEPLIAEKLAILQAAEAFADKLTAHGKVKCPACGQSISVNEFQAHVETELVRLREIRGTFNERNVAMGALCDSVKSIQSNLGKPDVKPWRDEVAKGTLTGCFAHLDALKAEALRSICSDEELKEIETKLLPLVGAADAASIDAPRDVQQLSADMQVVEVAKATLEAKEQADALVRAEALISLLTALEHAVREEIRVRSKEVIADISEDIQRMWTILHPVEAIEDVHLYVPADADKAIDIGLKFHGKEQNSPRLTLSEGYRNSLGLCIFLAMARREADKDRPVFLDDVVVSLDRNHRGMIVELLEREFGGRQIVVLTHDRDWYTELRYQLNDGAWSFRTLLPYETPVVGIRWSHKTTTFGDARAQLNDRPDSGGNDARKIMDIELALIAERVQIRMPYLRFDKNDRRMSHDFLDRLVADGKRSFQKRADKDYGANVDAIEALEKAHQLLGSWGNRASHTFDIVRAEAAKLIDACEKALESFKCESCGKRVWFADAEGSEWVQCQCGKLRWRYGQG
jgi:DNA-directed RNA polymerase subunit RPC12/RpoP